MIRRISTLALIGLSLFVKAQTIPDALKSGASRAEIEQLIKTKGAGDQLSKPELVDGDAVLETIPVPASLEVEEPENLGLESVSSGEAMSPGPLNSVNSNGIYGSSLFNADITPVTENSDRLVPSPNYLIGSGDVVSVTVWGASEFSGEYTVDALGNISPKLVGRISLKGKTYQETEKVLKSRFSSLYNTNSSNISIQLVYSQFINIHVTGDVTNPGSYSTPAVNSIFNVLQLAGGPSELGSYRNIHLKRDGKVIDSFDVYEFLMNPTKYKLASLRDGDYIVIQSRGLTVETADGFRKNTKFELKDSESLNDLLLYSGGLTYSADKRFFHVLRTENNSQQIIDVVGHNDSLQNFLLRDGDQVMVSQSLARLSGKVKVEGELKVPADYNYIKGESLGELVKRSGGFTHRSDSSVAYIFRLNDDFSRKLLVVDMNDPAGVKTKIQDLDIVRVFDLGDFAIPYSIEVYGAVKKEGEIDFSEGMNLEDAIKVSNGFTDAAKIDRIEIARKVAGSSGDSDIKRLSLDYSKDKDFLIAPYDVIYVRIKPDYLFEGTVEIEGEVIYPGKYSISAMGTRVNELIEMSGGFKAIAEKSKVYIQRTSEEEERVLVDMSQKKAKKYNIYLQPGDKIIVPRYSDVVKMKGDIGYNQINESGVVVPYVKKRTGYYIKNHGGNYNKKLRKKVTVVSTNGAVSNSRFLGLFNPTVSPGDQIIVNRRNPEKEQKKKDKKEVDWNRQIENLTVKATALFTLYLIISR